MLISRFYQSARRKGNRPYAQFTQTSPTARHGPTVIASSSLVLAAILAISSPARAQPDRTAPVFAGLRSAMTCIPGPVDGERTGIYHLAWAAAHDNLTPQRGIRYEIFQTTTPGTETFSHPTYTTRPGATSFATPPLPANAAYYFVVRARDKAGNTDHNRRQLRANNLCF